MTDRRGQAPGADGDLGRAWRDAAAADPLLRRWGGAARLRLCLAGPGPEPPLVLDFGKATAAAGDRPEVTLRAPPEVWAKVLAPIPPRHHHSLFALRMRVPAFRVLGEEIALAQHAHLVRRVLEVGRWVAAGREGPVPPDPRPPIAEPDAVEIRGTYLPVTIDGVPHRLHAEQAGQGRDLLCLHTAGSDGRQFHRLMADPRITRHWRLTAFDLPWHGKSPPPAGALPGDWRLTTDRYVQAVLGVVRAAGLQRPVVLGASMSGEICLELGLRHPERFAGIIACEASDHIEGRRTPWADHPQVNQALFVPEWIEGLMAPQSPGPCAAEVWWHYSQGGFATFARDIDFYSGEWDARERIHRFDTARCPLFMLTGEYDYSCTVEHSAATAARIPGARFQAMAGIGHFPFAENPPLFAEYLLPILEELRRGRGG